MSKMGYPKNIGIFWYHICNKYYLIFLIALLDFSMPVLKASGLFRFFKSLSRIASSARDFQFWVLLPFIQAWNYVGFSATVTPGFLWIFLESKIKVPSRTSRDVYQTDKNEHRCLSKQSRSSDQISTHLCTSR